MEKRSKTDYRALQEQLLGEIHWDSLYQGIYATDASNYQIKPLAVVYPKSEEDVVATLQFANHHRIPLLARGGGTSLVGQTVGEAIVLDFTKYMNKILDYDPEGRWAWVQPGLVRDEMNTFFKTYGLHFAPDPATTSRATVGGMIANNSSGTRSILYGKTLDHTLELRVLLSDGNVFHFRDLTAAQLEEMLSGNNRESQLYKGLFEIVSNNRGEILDRFPKVMRRVGGYNLDEFLGDHWNLSRIITGSESTLGIILSAKVKLVPNPAHQSVCVVHFDSFYESIAHVSEMVRFGPAAIELLDEMLIQKSRENIETRRYCGFIQGEPKGALVVEFYGENKEDSRNKALKMAVHLKSKGIGYSYPVFSEAEEIRQIFTVRQKGLGLLMGVKGNRKPIAFIEDAAVPLEHLADYIMEVYEVCREENTPVVAYAHASVGLLHVKPMLDLRDPEDILRMKNISFKTLALVQKYKGSWSGEHGDGLARGPYNELFFGKKLYQAFRQVKELFDPLHLMNPGKIGDSPPPDQNLRYGPYYRDQDFKSMYHYRAEGSFHEATHLCNGVGECRKTSGGTMCPSFRATLDEKDSTRARANALRLALSGQLDVKGLYSESLQEVLDLCLSCKACKSECPSNVDMSKLKSEIIHLQKSKKGFNTTDLLVRYQGVLSGIASGRLSFLFNAVLRSTWFRKLLEHTAGIDQRRILPMFDSRPFKGQKKNEIGSMGKEVVLFADCYTRHHDSTIGKNSLRLLEKLGYRVNVMEQHCCQRPALSRGMLDIARNRGLSTFQALEPYLKKGIPILLTEPSCASSFSDDLADLMTDDIWFAYREQFMLLEDFLVKEKESGQLKNFPGFKKGSYLLHGHCHQKALNTTQSVHKLFETSEDVRLSEIPSGCCGMAGMFGYEKKHYDISEKIAELSLLPAIRSAGQDVTVLAQGFSCRHQIDHFGERKAIHWVEALQLD